MMHGWSCRGGIPPIDDDTAWSPVLTGLSAGAFGYADVTALVTGLMTRGEQSSELCGKQQHDGWRPGPEYSKDISNHPFNWAARTKTLSFAENATVNLGENGQTLTIIKQHFMGNSSRFPGVGYTNATAIVTGLVTNNQLNFVANNSTLGGDPALNIVKTLQITFQLGGTNQDFVVR